MKFKDSSLKNFILKKAFSAFLFLILLTSFAISSFAADELAGGQIMSKETRTYGKIEIRMWAEQRSGTTSTYYWWREGGTNCGTDWNEIDIETLSGRGVYQSNALWQINNQPACNYPYLSEGWHSNAATVFGRWIVFTLEWAPGSIKWYHDGILDRTLTGTAANTIANPMKYCFNLWSQGPTSGWLGNLDMGLLGNDPVFQFVDYFKYYAWTGTGYAGTPTKTINFDSYADLTANFDISTWEFHSQSNYYVHWRADAVGVVDLGGGNGGLWLGLFLNGGQRPPAGAEIPGGGVTTPVLTTITVTPATSTLTTGQTQLFAAAGKDQNGNAIAMTPTWTVTGGGTISNGGLFTATTAGGPFTISATSGAVSGTATVTVNAPPTVTTLPGVLQAEDYSAYNNAENTLMRVATTDAGGGTKMGYNSVGDWYDYSVNVSTAGTYTVTFRVANGATTTGQFQLLSGANVLATVNVAPTAGWDVFNTLTANVTLGAGTQTLRIYTAAAGVDYNWFNFALPVNVAPTAALTAPANNSTYGSPASITITATATDTDGTISKVEFYNGTVLLNSDVTSPYSYTWTNVAAGTYTITAKAYDNLNATGTSAARTVSVAAPVLTSIVVSPANSTVEKGASVDFNATAYDQFNAVYTGAFTQNWTTTGGGTINSTSGILPTTAAGNFTVSCSNVNGGTEVFTNSTFDNALTDWTPQIYAPAAGTITSAGGVATMNVTTAGTANWNFRLWQAKDLTVQTYTLEARVRATAGTRLIQFVAEKNATPYTAYLASTQTVTTAWQVFTLPVNVTVAENIRVGLFIGANAGAIEVDYISLKTAAVAGVTGSTTLTVNETVPVLTTIAFTASPATTTAGTNATFVAQGYDQLGQAMVAPITYSVSAGATISTAGVFASTTPGSYIVTATSGTVTKTATIAVSVGAINTITVTAPLASITSGLTQQYTAVAKDAYNNTVTTNFTWAITGGGTISNTGLFTATTVGGPFNVTATSGTVLGTATVTVTAPATTIAVPGILQAEDYFAYNNAQPTQMRVATTDGGTKMGYNDAGDWYDYNVNVAAAGTYTLSFRVSNGAVAAGQFQLLKGAAVLTTVDVAPTGGWENFVTLTKTVTLTEGIQTLRIATVTAGVDYNWVNFQTVCNPTALTAYSQINGGTWLQTTTSTLDAGGSIILGPQPTTGGTWSWTGPNGFTANTREITLNNILTTQAGNYVATFTNSCGTNSTITNTITVNNVVASLAIPGIVQAEDYSAYNNAENTVMRVATTDGGIKMGWNSVGDWYDYSVNVATAGNYTVDFRVANGATTAGQFQLLKGAAIITTVDVAPTGGWENFVTLTKTVALTAGVQTIRINTVAAGVDYNWFEFKTAVSNPTVNSVAFNPPMTVESGDTYVIPVTYSSLTANEVQVAMLTNTFGWVVGQTQQVATGTGVLNFTITIPAGTAVGNTYIWQTEIRPVGGTWQQRYALAENLNVQVVNLKSATVGINDHSFGNEISIYPVPVTSMLNLKGVENVQKISVYNSVGQLLKQYKKGNETLFNIDVNELRSGIYFVELSNASEKVTKKVIKK